MMMSGMGMIGCAIAYLVPLVLLIVILVKVNRIDKTKKEACRARSGEFSRSVAKSPAARPEESSVVDARGTGDFTTHGFGASFPASLLLRLGAALRH